jgi:hypothetical protein
MLIHGGQSLRPTLAPANRASPRVSSTRAMTLVEVVTALCLIALISTSLIAASVLTRRLTEVAVYQSSVAAIMQGYVEQIKNMPYDMLPISPPSTTAMTDATYVGLYSLATQKDDTTTDPLILSPLPLLAPANLLPPAIPTGVYDNTKTFDVNRGNDLTLHIWVWIEDKTPSGYGATQQAKAITLLYMWQIRDGNTTRSYTGVFKNLRSLVPTY